MKFTKIISLLALAIAINNSYALNYDTEVKTFGPQNDTALVSNINKSIVTSFYDIAINKKDFASARQYLGMTYKQHNPLAKDGVDGFRQYIQFLKEHFPNSHSEIKSVFADGNFVMLHVHSVLQPNSRGRAIVDIFRLENEKIVEHWDVSQEIPENPANDNGMF